MSGVGEPIARFRCHLETVITVPGWSARIAGPIEVCDYPGGLREFDTSEIEITVTVPETTTLDLDVVRRLIRGLIMSQIDSPDEILEVPDEDTSDDSQEFPEDRP